MTGDCFQLVLKPNSTVWASLSASSHTCPVCIWIFFLKICSFVVFLLSSLSHPHTSQTSLLLHNSNSSLVFHISASACDKMCVRIKGCWFFCLFFGWLVGFALNKECNYCVLKEMRYLK